VIERRSVVSACQLVPCFTEYMYIEVWIPDADPMSATYSYPFFCLAASKIPHMWDWAFMGGTFAVVIYVTMASRALHSTKICTCTHVGVSRCVKRNARFHTHGMKCIIITILFVVLLGNVWKLHYHIIVAS